MPSQVSKIPMADVSRLKTATSMPSATPSQPSAQLEKLSSLVAAQSEQIRMLAQSSLEQPAAAESPRPAPQRVVVRNRPVAFDIVSDENGVPIRLIPIYEQ